MRSHLSERDLIDALEGLTLPPAREHALSCSDCGSKLASLREGLALTRDADVPEPSPLYWEAFRRQLDRRIDVGEGVAWRFGWRPALLAMAAASVILSVALPGMRTSAPAPATPTQIQTGWQPLPPGAEDSGLSVLQSALEGNDDLGEMDDSDNYARCLAALSESESQALVDALGHQMAGKDS